MIITTKHRAAGKGQEFVFSDKNALVSHLAMTIAIELVQAIAERDTASLLVSGGSTPKDLFKNLSQQAIDWEKVWISLVDERWVATSAVDSNEYLIRQVLLQHHSRCARFVPLKNAAPTPELGQSECSKALSLIPKPFDLVILGMGEDGHTASLFPGSTALKQGLYPIDSSLCIAIYPPHAPHPRMTLTLPTLLNSRHLILLLQGNKKWQTYQQAYQDSITVEIMPIRALLIQEKVPLDVYWSS